MAKYKLGFIGEECRKAISEGDEKTALSLIRAADPAANDLKALLASAAANGMYRASKTLLKAGADANYCDESIDIYYSGVMASWMGQNRKIASLLAQYGLDPTGTSFDKVLDICVSDIAGIVPYYAKKYESLTGTEYRLWNRALRSGSKARKDAEALSMLVTGYDAKAAAVCIDFMSAAARGAPEQLCGAASAGEPHCRRLFTSAAAVAVKRGNNSCLEALLKLGLDEGAFIRPAKTGLLDLSVRTGNIAAYDILRQCGSIPYDRDYYSGEMHIGGISRVKKTILKKYISDFKEILNPPELSFVIYGMGMLRFADKEGLFTKKDSYGHNAACAAAKAYSLRESMLFERKKELDFFRAKAGKLCAECAAKKDKEIKIKQITEEE